MSIGQNVIVFIPLCLMITYSMIQTWLYLRNYKELYNIFGTIGKNLNFKVCFDAV